MSAKRKSKKLKEEETMENVNEIVNNTEEIVTPETVEEVIETTEETTVETNEVKEEVTEVTENVEEVQETPETEVEEGSTEPEVIEAAPVIGRICGFSKLYVRSEASRDSEPVGTVDDKEDLVIDLENSTEDFYKVRTTAGIDGYCVKSNVKID